MYIALTIAPDEVKLNRAGAFDVHKHHQHSEFRDEIVVPVGKEMWILVIAAGRRYMDYNPTDELCKSMFHVLKSHFIIVNNETGLCKELSTFSDGKKKSSDADLGWCISNMNVAFVRAVKPPIRPPSNKPAHLQ